MSAIEASSVQVKTMADDTLRLTVDIEPRYAAQAFALFGARGTAMALAAIVPEHKREPEAVPAEKPKGGELAKLAAVLGQDREFQSWLANNYPAQWDGASAIAPGHAARCASVIRAVCSIDSRAELDSDSEAALRFHNMIRRPYQARPAKA